MSSTTIRRVITDCALVDPQTSEESWGDLYEVGDYWVFNGEPLRFCTDKLPELVMQLVIHDSLHQLYFHRRGVIVIPKDNATLNKAAQEYLS